MIRKHVRQELRKRKSNRVQKILSEFIDLERIDDARRLPVLHTKSVEADEIRPDDFASYLETVFKTSMAHQHEFPASLLEKVRTYPGPVIQPFNMGELRRGLMKMKNRKCCDKTGIVIEMLKHASREYLQTLLGLYNDMLSTGQIDVAWRETIFSMLPKSGDLTQAKNWRPIAILRISYKLFSRLLYHRLQPILDQRQSADQVGFRAGRSVEDAFVVLETMSSKCIEWDVPLWCMSLDLSKAFDRIELEPLFQALSYQGICEKYLGVLASTYTG